MKNRILAIALMLALLVTMLPAEIIALAAGNDAAPVMMLEADGKSTEKIKLDWHKVDGATKYVVYGNRADKNKLKKLATVKDKTKYTVKSIKDKELDGHKYYNFVVEAYKGKKLIAKSLKICVITGNYKGEYANVKTITADKTTLELKVGKKGKVGATYTMYKNKKHMPKRYGDKLSYISADESIATVDEKGNVTAVAEGNTVIYIVDIGGKFAKVKVTVKADKPAPTATPTPKATATPTAAPEGTPTTTPEATPVPVYKVTFDGNGSDTTYSETIDETYGTNYVLPSSEPAKTGYTFKGWNTAEDGKGDDITVDTKVELTADTAVYAKWEANIYKVTFNGNGSDETYSEILDETYGASYVLPATDPVKKDYAFIGWNTKQDGTGTEITDAIAVDITADTTVYAQWKEKSLKATLDSSKKLTLYYDIVDHSGEGTVYTDIPTAAKDLSDWPWADDAANITAVVVDKSLEEFKGFTSLAYMFGDFFMADSISGAENIDVSGVTSMNSMFAFFGYSSAKINSVPDVSKWDTSNVTDMNSMFLYYGYSTSLDIGAPDISEWNVEKVTDISGLFNSYGSSSANLNFTLDLSNWQLSKVSSCIGVFNYAGNKASAWNVKIPGTTVLTAGGIAVNTETEWYMPDGSIVAPCNGKKFAVPMLKATLDSGNKLTLYYDMKDHSSEGTVFTDISAAAQSAAEWKWDGSRGDITAVVIDKSLKEFNGFTSLAYMFYNFDAAKSISGAEYLDVSNVVDMRYAFYKFGYDCTDINSVPNVTKWDTSNVTNMSYMFSSYGYRSKQDTGAPNVSEWNVEKVTDMHSMFNMYGSRNKVLTFVLDLSKWQPKSVATCDNIFTSAGSGAATWKVTIPKTTLGSSISNTETAWYMGNVGIIAPPTGKKFTVAAN